MADPAPTLHNDEQLRRLLDRVVAEHQPLAVYLFGSRADAASDYDLLIVLPDDASEEALDATRAYDTGVRAGVPADIIPTTRELFQACVGELSTLEGVVHARGKLIYS
jgi:predicted nucleotidyltransferase